MDCGTSLVKYILFIFNTLVSVSMIMMMKTKLQPKSKTGTKALRESRNGDGGHNMLRKGWLLKLKPIMCSILLQICMQYAYRGSSPLNIRPVCGNAVHVQTLSEFEKPSNICCVWVVIEVVMTSSPVQLPAKLDFLCILGRQELSNFLCLRLTLILRFLHVVFIYLVVSSIQA